jgi:hypothetical protein
MKELGKPLTDQEKEVIYYNELIKAIDGLPFTAIVDIVADLGKWDQQIEDIKQHGENTTYKSDLS